MAMPVSPAHSFKYLILIIILAGCQRSCQEIEPCLRYHPPKELVQSLPTAFPYLSPDEKKQEWSKEYFLGIKFAQELDWYRAITCFKRSQFFLPAKEKERKLQNVYTVLQSYYMGKKYQEALDIFETTPLNTVTTDFPAFRELSIMAADSYHHTDRDEKACYQLEKLAAFDAATADKLSLSWELQSGNLCHAPESLCDFTNCYRKYAKSTTQARLMNALLPGAGYAYVGQYRTAMTSLILNALFITASYQLFKNKQTGWGIVTASLEAGWYLGGINGAGLAAREYNERLYESGAKEVMVRERLFPVLFFQTLF
ncbi:MAG: tetratricopeptide repeat protein [Chlamydiia bacterium]|nr:tetratricopeptide repeat protein [Chlamydiia bacterium]